MKINTKLTIIFLTVILLPIVLSVLAYFIIGFALTWNIRNAYGNDSIRFSVTAAPTESYNAITDDYYDLLVKYATEDPAKLDDKDSLAFVDEKLQEVSAFLVVKKNEEIFYVSDQAVSEAVLRRLPEYGGETETQRFGYYFDDLQRLVRQIDVTFTDGATGSIYIVTKINMMVSEAMVTSILAIILLVLLLTSILLTLWLRSSIFRPVNQLKVAMKSIAEGNFDTPVTTGEKGELGALFTDFEQMRVQLKATAEEKLEAEQNNRELISNITHDLKTPITSIKGYVEGIMDGVADSPEKIDRYIRTIYTKANDMDRMINELTMYSRIETNSIPYQFQRICVRDYFSDCAEEVGLDLESRGIEFRYRCDIPADVYIWADPEQLKRVADNIISNSIKYRNGENSFISLYIYGEEELVRVEIADNGKGIGNEEYEKIFERFYRTDVSRNSSKGGSGIGLSIAKRIIEEHDGRIWAGPGPENVGLTVHMEFKMHGTPAKTDVEAEDVKGLVKIEKMIKNTTIGIRTGAEKRLQEFEKLVSEKKAETAEKAEKAEGERDSGKKWYDRKGKHKNE